MPKSKRQNIRQKAGRTNVSANVSITDLIGQEMVTSFVSSRNRLFNSKRFTVMSKITIK